ncbi:hypothetical protein IE077_004505 [Cardiosporidium cionae]|uniref:G domain-containing protein n=1 Tax=Cardiosporidium cionae TaxID=476202 RepID=A0ABQ7JF52_9APIC|nr:hypothetical protein IE077_004505 [Cardiosporidium cionae]|eukprot:KAF8822627.1 hypothetical protein IE077_004505 [Cardiosporidium cionae]
MYRSKSFSFSPICYWGLCLIMGECNLYFTMFWMSLDFLLNIGELSIIVVNKADLLTRFQRKQWLEFFKKQDKEVIFFSAIRELYIQGAIHATQSSEFPHKTKEFRMGYSGITLGYGNLHAEDADDSPSDILTCEALLRFLQEKKRKCFTLGDNSAHSSQFGFIVGVVGYPNVGKSSMINSLFGSKKVSVSRQPDFANARLWNNPMRLPSENNDMLLCINVQDWSFLQLFKQSIIFFGDYLSAIQLICNWIPEQLCLHYKVMMNQLSHAKTVGKFSLDASTFLSQLAESRHFYSGGRGGLLDLFRTAAMITKDFCCGKLLYCAPPPLSGSAFSQDEEGTMKMHAPPLSINGNNESLEVVEKTKSLPLNQLEEPSVDEDDNNIAEFLHPPSVNHRNHPIGRNVTKRGRRHMEKQFLKGNAVSVDSYGGYLV